MTTVKNQYSFSLPSLCYTIVPKCCGICSWKMFSWISEWYRWIQPLLFFLPIHNSWTSDSGYIDLWFMDLVILWYKQKRNRWFNIFGYLFESPPDAIFSEYFLQIWTLQHFQLINLPLQKSSPHSAQDTTRLSTIPALFLVFLIIGSSSNCLFSCTLLLFLSFANSTSLDQEK